MIKAVVFDMDGLIVDNEPLHSQSVEIVLRKYGKTPIYNKNGLVHEVGIAGEQEYIDLLSKYGLLDEREIFRRKRRKVYVELIKRSLTPRQGFTSLVKMLRKSGIKIGLASNRMSSHIKIILKNMKVAEYFDAIAGYDRRSNPKPEPDIYLRAARKLKIKPGNCIAEDTEPGIISAKAAGMKAIAIPNEYTNDQDFSKADLVVNSLIDIKWSTLNI